MGNGVRWSIAAVILMIAGVVAIWPRSDPEPAPQDTVRAEQDLSSARAAAGLSGCPFGTGGPRDLRGITVECLADGTTIDVEKAFGGAPLLVNMWATWCPPCKAELPVLDAYAKEPGAIPVVTLGVESRPGDALELLTALKVDLPTLLDEDGRTKQKLHPIGLPASYLVENGTITRIESPLVFESVDQVKQAVANGGAGG